MSDFLVFTHFIRYLSEIAIPRSLKLTLVSTLNKPKDKRKKPAFRDLRVLIVRHLEMLWLFSRQGY